MKVFEIVSCSSNNNCVASHKPHHHQDHFFTRYHTHNSFPYYFPHFHSTSIELEMMSTITTFDDNFSIFPTGQVVRLIETRGSQNHFSKKLLGID